MKKKKKKEKKDYDNPKNAIIMLSTMLTTIIIVWYLLTPMFEEMGIIAQCFFYLLTGTGAIGYGMIITHKLFEIIKGIKK